MSVMEETHMAERIFEPDCDCSALYMNVGEHGEHATPVLGSERTCKACKKASQVFSLTSQKRDLYASPDGSEP